MNIDAFLSLLRSFIGLGSVGLSLSPLPVNEEGSIKEDNWEIRD